MEMSDKNRFFQNLIRTAFHTYFGPIFISHERKLSLVSRDIFIFFKSFWKALKIGFEVEKTKLSRIWRFKKKTFCFQNSIKTASHTYFGPIFISHERKLSLVSRDIFIFFQILLEVPKIEFEVKKTKLSP
jgi:hypothetical protein